MESNPSDLASVLPAKEMVIHLLLPPLNGIKNEKSISFHDHPFELQCQVTSAKECFINGEDKGGSEGERERESERAKGRLIFNNTSSQSVFKGSSMVSINQES